MASWGNCDYKQLQKLRDNLARLQSMDLDRFCTEVSKELAAKLLRLVIPRTPVGKYNGQEYVCEMGKHHGGNRVTGKNGGTLKRGWTAKNQAEADGGGGQVDVKAYANSLPVFKRGRTYYIEVINPVEYASYVEFGHRTVSGGWVSGHYFLTLSEQDLQGIAPGVIEKKLERLLRDVFKV